MGSTELTIEGWDHFKTRALYTLSFLFFLSSEQAPDASSMFRGLAKTCWVEHATFSNCWQRNRRVVGIEVQSWSKSNFRISMKRWVIGRKHMWQRFPFIHDFVEFQDAPVKTMKSGLGEEGKEDREAMKEGGEERMNECMRKKVKNIN